MRLERGIEIGHIFQLGRKYTDAFELDILDENGSTAASNGSYGVGVSRLVAVLAEQLADDAGLKWPVAVAPYAVHIAAVGKNAEAAAAAGRAGRGTRSRRNLGASRRACQGQPRCEI